MNHLVLYSTILFGFIFTACSTSKSIYSNSDASSETVIKYTTTYYIHADSDYLYHTTDGKVIQGNSKVLKTAFDVAISSKSGEVFIFHQQPERKFLGLFPKKSSRLYHFKNGILSNRIKFRHKNKNEPFLSTEAEFVNQLRVNNQISDHRNYFLYFGHEIPTNSGSKYHRTLPNIEVNTVTFAQGIERFLLFEHQHFNLLVLSTCNNGTPRMAELLAPFTKVLLASPQNLHLSHIDSDKMSLLEKEADITSVELAQSMAEQTFMRLSKTVLSTVSLSLYNLEDLRPFNNILTPIKDKNGLVNQVQKFQDNLDCADLYNLSFEEYQDGTQTWFKAARFGRNTVKIFHSGWGCKPLIVGD